MKKLAYGVVVFAVTTFSVVATALADSHRDIYLLLGGRNMSGRGAVNECNRMPTNRVQKLTSSLAWVDAVEPIHYDTSAAAGPAASFAAIMAAADPDATICLVPCAVGSSQASTWASGGANYSTALSRARAALEGGGTIKAILWCQGLSDADGSTKAAAYVDNVKSLAENLRADLNLGDTVPFIVATHPESPGRDGTGSGTAQKVRWLNEKIRLLPEEIENCALVEGKWLMTNSDRLCYNAESCRDLGEGFARALFECERKQAGRRLVVGAIERQAISGSDVIAPPVEVTDATTGHTVPSEGFTVAYRSNDALGYGVAVVSGAAGTAYAGEVAYAPFRVVHPVFVAPDGLDANDGSSWANATTITNALALAGTTNEVWMKAGTYLRNAAIKMVGALRIRGGYRGYAGELADDPISIFDGGGTLARFFYNTYNEKAYENVYNKDTFHTYFSRLGFTRAATRAITRQGQGRIEVDRCRFYDISPNTGGGLAIGMSAAYGYGEILVQGCTFANLCNRNSTWISPGLCINGGNGASIIVEDSLFVSNGVPWNFVVPSSTLHGQGRGLAAKADSCPIEFRNCVFRANRATASADQNSSIIEFNATKRTNVVERCLIVGNEFIGRGTGNQYWKKTTSGDGMIVIASGAKAVVDSCTVAYNLSDSTYSPAGVLVKNGYAHIRNSIVCNNIASSDSLVGSDLFLDTSGTALVENSMFTEDAETSRRSAEPTHLTMKDCIFGDAGFVTPMTAVTNIVCTDNKGSATYSPTHIRSNIYFDKTKQDVACSFDVHLRSSAGTCLNDGSWTNFANEISGAIDAGDPESDFSLEPTPNGNRRNIGFYGNTPEASKSPTASPVFSSDIEVTFPGGFTQPRFSVSCDDAGGGAYSGVLTVYCGTNGVFTATNVYTAVSPGDEISGLICDCYPPGAEVTVRAVLEALGARTETSSTAFATGVVPSSYGKGGGGTVVHVRPGATGRNDGSDWFHAYDCSLHSAFQYLDSARTNLWFAGETNILNVAPLTFSPARATALYGGFVGTENSPAERHPGSVTVVDGAATYTPLTVSTDKAVAIDGFAFVHGESRGFFKNYAGDLKLVNCRFEFNGQYHASPYGGVEGRGAYLQGTFEASPSSVSATLTVSNCVFAENYRIDDRYINENVISGIGGGAFIRNWKKVVMDGCVFTNNCNKFDFAVTSSGMQGVSAAALYLFNSTVSANNCRFCFNHGGTGNASNLGGIVAFASKTEGSAFTNCLFMGNIEQWHRNTGPGWNGGTIRIETGSTNVPVEIVNCTVFANLSDGTACSGGINVRSGAVKVRDSIVFANKVGQNRAADAGDDLLVHTNAVADVANTIFTSRESVTNRLGGRIVLGGGVVFDDARLATTYAEVTNSIADVSGSQGAATWFKPERRAAVMAFNAHLRGGRGYFDEQTGELVTDYMQGQKSPAIDAGDPESDYSREPDCLQGWHGKRRNLGYYGNTPWATMTAYPGGMIILR
ncbi:MAG: hypothetical protein IJG70_08615 [Kiritimatiellae bacterium]|nr:hypothetical protein [Kiritimatiellia bacterium]